MDINLSFTDDMRQLFEDQSVELVAFAGKKRSGKDTAGSIFASEFGFERLKLSSTIQDVVQTVFRFPEDWTHGDLKDEPYPNLGLSYRKAMQFVGTDLFQEHVSEHIWTWSLFQKIREKVQKTSQRRFVVTDARFSFQCRSIEDVGGTVFYIKRDLLVAPWKRWIATSFFRHVFSFPSHLHPSEIELDGTRYAQNPDLVNDGTLGEFKDKVRALATASGDFSGNEFMDSETFDNLCKSIEQATAHAIENKTQKTDA